MPIYAYAGIRPVIDETFIHPEAVVIGDVIIGSGALIAPCASLRGDMGRLIVGDGANIQDGCVMHGFPARTARSRRTAISGTAPSCTAAGSGGTLWSA